MEEEIRLLNRIVDDLKSFRLKHNGLIRTIWREGTGWVWRDGQEPMGLIEAIRQVEQAEKRDDMILAG